jgi:DNA-binding transcriptional LysR family regulator
VQDITFQQLEAFLTAAERLNLTETADMMFISQSALSKIITRLEVSIGVKLFVRENRGVSLTAEGRYLYDTLKKPLEGIAQAISVAQSMQKQLRQDLHIGCTSAYDYNSDYSPVKHAVKEYRDTYPYIDVVETILEPDLLRQALIFSNVDVIVSQSFLVDGLRDVTTIMVQKLDTNIVVSYDHPMAQQDNLDPDKLDGETIYLISVGRTGEPDAQTEMNTKNLCASLGFLPKEIKFVPNTMSLIHALKSGGVGFCGKVDFVPSDIRLRHYPFPGGSEVRQLYVNVSWMTKTATPQVKDFVRILRKHVRV